MSNLPPAEPPRFIMPGSTTANDPAAGATDPVTTDPALSSTEGADPAAADPAGQPATPAADPATPSPAEPSAPEYDTLEAAIAAAINTPEGEPISLDAGNPAPEDGDAGSEGSSLPSDPAGSTDADIPPADPHPVDDLIDLGGGKVWSKSEAAEFYDWLQTLTPEDQRAIEAITNPSAPSPYPSAASGSGTPAPVGPPAGAGSYYPGQYPAAGQPGMPLPPVPTASPIREKLGELAEVVPGLAEILEAQQAQVEAQRDQIARYQAEQAQQQFAAEQARIAEGVRAGDEQFVAAHPELAPTDLHYIRQQALQSGLMAAQLPKHGGNPVEAYKATLETVMWADERYRDILVQQQATEIARRQAETAERRENASALSGNAGSVPRESQSAPALQTPEGRRLGMREYIAAALAGGTP